MNLKNLGFYRAWTFIGNNSIGFQWMKHFWESQPEFLSSHMIIVLKYKRVFICLFIYSFLIKMSHCYIYFLRNGYAPLNEQIHRYSQDSFVFEWDVGVYYSACTNILSLFSFIFLIGHFCGFILLDKCCWSRIIIWLNALIWYTGITERLHKAVCSAS